MHTRLYLYFIFHTPTSVFHVSCMHNLPLYTSVQQAVYCMCSQVLVLPVLQKSADRNTITPQGMPFRDCGSNSKSI